MAKEKKRRVGSQRPVVEDEPEPNAIPVQFADWAGTAPWHSRDVIRSLQVLITAFEEVDGYDPQRHHNQPPPTLWLDNRAYLTDLKSLLQELRELNKVLRELADKDKEPSKAATRKISATFAILGVGGKKFVESYADLLGKGAAALTIGAVAGFLASSGLPRELVDAVWEHLKLK